MIQIVMVMFVFIAGIPLAFAGPLHNAARDGDLEKARTLIGEGAAIDARSDRGETPLIVAILAGNDAVAELLIEKVAGVMATNQGGFTPLHRALLKNHEDMVILLKAHGAECQSPDVLGDSLHLACLDAGK